MPDILTLLLSVMNICPKSLLATIWRRLEILPISMAISSASAVTITLTLISIFLMFSFNLDQFTREIEGTVQVSATLNYECDSEDELRIRQEILNIEGVDKVTYKTSDEEFEYSFSCNNS